MAEFEDERDKLLDHEYDGIREYDNPLPRWWVTLFILSTLLAFPYTLYYHFGVGTSILEALEGEIADYAANLLETYGELEPDQKTIMAYMQDDVAMTGMSGLFKGKCAQCHLADGSGSVGPNLTDENWISVRRITDIPDLLKAGVVTRGMPAWEGKLTETQIVLLSSYVARLRETPVAGKPPQGDPVPPWSAVDEPIEEAGAAEEPAGGV